MCYLLTIGQREGICQKQLRLSKAVERLQINAGQIITNLISSTHFFHWSFRNLNIAAAKMPRTQLKTEASEKQGQITTKQGTMILTEAKAFPQPAARQRLED